MKPGRKSRFSRPMKDGRLRRGGQHVPFCLIPGLTNTTMVSKARSRFLVYKPGGAVPGRARGAPSSLAAALGLYADVGLLFHLTSELCLHNKKISDAPEQHLLQLLFNAFHPQLQTCW